MKCPTHPTRVLRRLLSTNSDGVAVDTNEFVGEVLVAAHGSTGAVGASSSTNAGDRVALQANLTGNLAYSNTNKSGNLLGIVLLSALEAIAALDGAGVAAVGNGGGNSRKGSGREDEKGGEFGEHRN
jgi:hypothetical protein